MELGIEWTSARRRANSTRATLIAGLIALAAAIVLMLPAQAFAVDPQATVGPPGSKWYSGPFLMQPGMNCSIIGGAYSETMVTSVAGYGGAPGSGVVHINDRYYASLLVSIPGNPCGSGSTIVATDLALPHNTAYDPTGQIRCFGQPRNASTFSELTGGNWSFTFSNGNTSTGPYCPTTAGPSQSGYGGIGVGYRPLASGQMFQLFVPIKSTQTLIGAVANPADTITWVLNSSAAYNTLGSASVWTNVFASAGAGGPFIYFARNPSVVPFWNTSAPAGWENQVELFANLYSAGQTGTFCFEVYLGTSASGTPEFTCNTAGITFTGAIYSTYDPWQVFGTGGNAGPHGGYTPWAYEPSTTHTIRWIFDPTGPTLPITKDIIFTTLSGPDNDGDGVPDASDACPTVAGTPGNGCQPAVPPPDPDGDGIFGDIDMCPTQNGTGTLDGCPLAVAPPPSALPPIGGTLATIKGNKLKRAALAKGVLLSIGCALNSKATATLSVTAKTAKKLKLPIKKKAKTLTIGSASASCTAGKTGKLKLKLKRPFAKKIVRARGKIPATLSIEFTRAGATPATLTRALKLI